MYHLGGLALLCCDDSFTRLRRIGTDHFVDHDAFSGKTSRYWAGRSRDVCGVRIGSRSMARGRDEPGCQQHSCVPLAPFGEQTGCPKAGGRLPVGVESWRRRFSGLVLERSMQPSTEQVVGSFPVSF